METIDVSEVLSVFNGHSAHRDSGEIQQDLNVLLHRQLGADQRDNLEPVDTPEGRYWRLRPLP